MNSNLLYHNSLTKISSSINQNLKLSINKEDENKITYSQSDCI